MVSGVVAIALLLAAAPAWGGGARQLCLSCHPAHYAEKGGCSLCHLGNPASERKNIAHAGLRPGKYARFTLGGWAEAGVGERLMDRLACRRCHVSGGRGNHLAVSLDAAAARKTGGELALSIRVPVANMPDFRLNEDRITLLVNTIFAGSQGRSTDESDPVRVHFNTPGKKSPDIFSTKCGSCHRILSDRLGAVGTGEVGPNLSGLFTQYYPKTFRNNEVWTVQNLNLWLKNPRETRPWARMLPVTLTGAELKELVSVINLLNKREDVR
ncbi:MAG: selenite/tellurite reduction operon c-type cytochrome lipoprotein ExtS [Desulfuromonadaceae bacterium]